jgi:hypothetical protein
MPPSAPAPVDLWSRFGLLATALFTGVTAVISWLALQQVRTVTGVKRPVVVDSKRPVGHIGYDQSLHWSYEGWNNDPKRLRYVDLYVYNRSDVEQRFMIDADSSGIVWPRFRQRLFIQNTELRLDPRYGGNSPVPVLSLTGEWPTDELDNDGTHFKRTYWLRLRGLTRSGHVVKFLGRVRLRPYPPVEADE